MLSDDELQSVPGQGLNGHGQTAGAFTNGTSKGQEDGMSDDDMPLVCIQNIQYTHTYLL